MNAWLRVDLDTLATMASESAVAYRNVHRDVNAEHNAKWAERIRGMLASEEVEFVSLEVGKLVRPNDVLNQLEAAGAQVERLKL